MYKKQMAINKNFKGNFLVFYKFVFNIVIKCSASYPSTGIRSDHSWNF